MEAKDTDDVVLRLTRQQRQHLQDLVVAAVAAVDNARRTNGVGAWALPRWIRDVHAALDPGDVSRPAQGSFALPEWERSYDVKAASVVLGVSQQAVRGLARRGTIPARRTKDRWGSWDLDADAVDQRRTSRGEG